MSIFVVPNVKVDMDITFGTTGWTESHYFVGTASLGDANLNTAAQNLALGRSVFLDPKQAAITDVRLSIDAVNRDAIHLDPSLLPVPGANGYPGQGIALTSLYNQGWNWQTPQVSWPVMFRTAQTTTRPIVYLAGFMGSDAQSGPLPSQDSDPTVQSFMQKYVSVLTNGLWGCKAKVWGGTANMVVLGNPVWTAGVNGGTATITFTLNNIVTNQFGANGGFVRLQSCKYSSPQKRLRLNGTYQVVNWSAATTPPFITVAAPRVIVQPNWFSGGYLQLAAAAVLPYTVPVSYRKITHKKRGRVTGAPRGRR